MKSAFPGFPTEGLDFFRKLQRNNRREWFQPRKSVFEEKLKQPMRDLVEALNAAMSRFAPDYVTDPDKAIYRIYRDTRFSKDKTPYKDHISASFARRGVPYGAGLYFQVSHKDVGIGGGIYMPSPETLRAMRQHIELHHRDFRKIIAARPVRELYGSLEGEQLTRVPKGFSSDSPAADLLKYKQFLLYIELAPELAGGTELYPEIIKRFRTIMPFLEFLNAPLTVKRKALSPLF